ncbi:ABC-type phosphate transport system permease subunit [Clostridiales Family XIII bacterium PM5-7]
MFFGGMFLLFFIPIMLLLSVGLPVIIGVCVYRDASKRVDCSPWLWALVAALVPSCIGLIVYLIIRKDYPLMGSGSGEQYQQGYTEYREEAPKHGMPTWGKALIIIGSVILGICILAGIGTVLYGIFGYHEVGTGIDYYQGF